MPEMTFTVRWAAAGERTYYAESSRRIHADAAGEVGDVVLVSMSGAHLVSGKS